MKSVKKLLSVFLIAVLMLGITPAPVKAELVDENNTLLFDGMTLSNAGPSQMNSWAMGEYLSVQEELSEKYGEDDMWGAEFLKTRLMIRTMYFNSFSYEQPIEFFIPSNSQGSLHEFTLSGVYDIDPADIKITGVTLKGDIKRRVFGDKDSEGNDGSLYWYTVPIFVPASNVTMSIYVNDECCARVPLSHVTGTFDAPLYSTMWVKDYEEGTAEGTLKSFTIQASGFNLPSDPLHYIYKWTDAESGDENSVSAKSVSAADQYGYRDIRFEFGRDVNGMDLIWGPLSFKTCPAYFFDAETHLLHTAEGEEVLVRDSSGNCTFITYPTRTESYPYGTECSVPSPYYCIYKDPRAVFTDVQNMDSWYYDAVYWAVTNGVSSGMGEGTFQPLANLSRAQTVMFLYKLAGQPDVRNLPAINFKDVKEGKWYYNAVRWAVGNGITNGYGEGTFQPDVTCNRAMIVTFLMRYAKLAGTYKAPTTSATFKDVPASAWYREAVDWAVASGVTTGYGEGTFQPMKTCNRAMMVTFLKRVAELPKVAIS